MSDRTELQQAVDHQSLHRHLDACIEISSAKQELFTVLFIHLRGIRRINTVLGYDVGERAVHVVLDRIQQSLPEGDTVGRISSDELIVVSLDCNSPSCAIKGSRATISELQKIIEIDGTDCTANPVIGIAIYPQDGCTSTELVRHAALAADEAALAEDPYYSFFSKGLGLNALKDFDLQQAIRRATSQRQFELHYQPKVNSENWQLAGCEALIRWRDPAGGLRMPSEFLAVAERGGLMQPIGYFVLKAACDQIRRWMDHGHENPAVSINVTASQFGTKDWVALVLESAETAGIPASCLTLEITEDCAMTDASDIIGKMKDLRSSGVKISIDDFGTGHSSLAYLSKLPVDEVKIDRYFVQSAFNDKTNAQICQSVIDLAHGIGAKVTGEGVETMEQAIWLRELGCDRFQGFLFDKPQPAERFETWFSAQAWEGALESAR